VGDRGRIIQATTERVAGVSLDQQRRSRSDLWVFEVRNGRLMDWSQGGGKGYQNTVGRWFNGYWDEAFYDDDSFRLGMLGGQFVY